MSTTVILFQVFKDPVTYYDFVDATNHVCEVFCMSTLKSADIFNDKQL